ncbi:MAG: DNA repair protein RadA [Cytophagales bacterium]|nr:DNA repair protein RadA [Cytophagales bacterium]MDW8383439.1 DNA repair protein RadA [Flammeovirgaceae bacterium]
MKKIKTSFFCQECGYESIKWLGKCPSCGSWNSFVEEKLNSDSSHRGSWKPRSNYAEGNSKLSAKPHRLSEIDYADQHRIYTPDEELNRVLGGGIMPGSIVLIGGEPGIGKSTLMLQIALMLSSQRVLYVSGEESEQQIKMRAERLGITSDNCFILTETNTQNIFAQAEIVQPHLLIVDSIQTLTSSYLESAAGSVSQVRECAAELISFGKQTHTSIFMIGHITKEGSLAGPKVLEHMVDTVLHFEGDRHLSYRVLRTVKNRFGSTSELGIYEMCGNGLKQVKNPSEILLSQRDEALSGITVGATLEGNRPLLIEVQSLVSASVYGTPQRTPNGFDAKRLNMLLAVLEKRGGYKLYANDVFLNITGGIKVEDPAIDLAVAVSIISSYEDIVIPNRFCFAGEVGLGGEIRAVSRIEQRIAEAQKLGFTDMYISKYNLKNALSNLSITLHLVGTLEDIVRKLFNTL